MAKYTLLEEDTRVVEGTTLYRLKALRSFSNVKEGDLGGYVSSEKNLSHSGDCWVYDQAYVYGTAFVSQNACLYDSVRVYGNASVSGDVFLYNKVEVFDNASLTDNAYAQGSAKVYGNASVKGSARLNDWCRVYGNATVGGKTCLLSKVQVLGDATILGHTSLTDAVRVLGNVTLDLPPRLSIFGETDIEHQDDFTLIADNRAEEGYILYLKPSDLWFIGFNLKGTTIDVLYWASKKESPYGSFYKRHIKKLLGVDTLYLK